MTANLQKKKVNGDVSFGRKPSCTWLLVIGVGIVGLAGAWAQGDPPEECCLVCCSQEGVCECAESCEEPFCTQRCCGDCSDDQCIAGSCTSLKVCCFEVGCVASCELLDPLCCTYLGGTPRLNMTSCTPMACPSECRPAGPAPRPGCDQAQSDTGSGEDVINATVPVTTDESASDSKTDKPSVVAWSLVLVMLLSLGAVPLLIGRRRALGRK